MNEYDDILGEQAPTPVNEYSDALNAQADEQRSALQQSMFVGAQSSPDRHAKVLELSKKTNLPADTVDRNFDEIQKHQTVTGTDYNALINETPGVAKWLENPDNSAVSHDDLPATTKLEKDISAYDQLRSMYNGLGVGTSQVLSGLAQTPALISAAGNIQTNVLNRILGIDRVNTTPDWMLHNPMSNYFDKQAADLKTPEMDLSPTKANGFVDFGQRLAIQAALNTPNLAALIGMSYLGAAPAQVGAAMGLSTAAQSNAQDQKPNLSQDTVAMGAGVKGLAEAVGETLGVLMPFHHWGEAVFKAYGKEATQSVMMAVAKTLIGTYATESAEEGATQLAQDLTDYVTGVNPDALKGMGRRIADAMVVGGFMGVGMTGPAAIGAGMQRAHEKAQADRAKEFYTAIGDTAEAQKLRERAPEAQRQLVEQITKDGPIEHIYVPVEAVKEYFQSRKEDPAAFMQSIGALETYTESAETGADVKIPLASWIHKVVGTEHYAGLANDVKFDPAAMTVNESKAAGEELKAQTEAAASQVQAPTADQSAAAVGQTIADQLVAAGADPSQAVVHEQAFKTLGQRMGIDPQELFNQYQLSVQGPNNGAAASLLTPDAGTMNQDAVYGPLPAEEEITQLRERLAQVERENGQLNTELRTSPLTGTRNARAFTEDESLAWPVVSAFDMDGLKRLNDHAGHEAADHVLRKIGALLLKAQGEGDNVRFYHRSGDEFAGRFRNAEEAQAFMATLQSEMAGTGVEIKVNGKPHQYRGIGISFGTGANYEEADTRANEQKQQRLDAGLRQDARQPGPPKQLVAVTGDQTGGQSGSPTVPPGGRTFDQSQVQTDSLGFYSKLQRTIEEKLGNTATVEQVEALLRDTKAEERKWSGIDEFLKGKEKVSKAELLEFLAANQLEVKEVTKGKGVQNFYIEERRDGTWGIFDQNRELVQGKLADRDTAQNVLEDEYPVSAQSSTKFSQYTLPGGENYREVLFTLPEKVAPRRLPEGYQLIRTSFRNSLAWEVKDPSGKTVGKAKTREQAIEKAGFDSTPIPEPENYVSGHWDEPNVLAHVRLNDRTDADGKKVLFVEEIQSDWHQAGRKKGYKGDRTVETKTEYQLLIDGVEIGPAFDTKEQADIAKVARERLGMNQGKKVEISEIQATYDKSQVGVPDAPFRRTWHEFALKRIIRMAAEGGYSKVAWTTGEQQAERYSISKHVGEIRYNKNTGLTQVKTPSGHNIGTGDTRLSPKELAETYGKEVADKIIAMDGSKSKGWVTLSGVDLKVGGEGMKGFYDKILVDFANKFGKKFGAKVGEADIESTDSEDDFDAGYSVVKKGKKWVVRNDRTLETVAEFDSEEPAVEHMDMLQNAPDNRNKTSVKAHSLEITEALKEAALNEGFSLFQGGDDGPRGQIQLSAGKAIITLSKSADFSTFSHESGHYFLEVLGHLASQDAAPQQIKDDFGKLLKWFGVESREQISREHHEMFARGFEKYLAEGNAPSEGLRSIFAQFKVWMIAVYKQIKNLNIELSDDVRGVMDRLLATDEEIAQARGTVGMAPLFTDAATFGLTGKKAERYLKATQDAKQAAEEELTGRIIREHNRHLAAWWKEEHAGVAQRIEKQVNAQPVYIADSVLRRGRLPDGSELPSGMQPIKLSRAALTPEQINGLPRGVTNKDGIHPDIAAEMFGFASGKELVDALSKAEGRQALINRLADNEMLDKHGDMLRDNKIQEEALNAVHNDKQAELLQLELEHLASNDLPALKDVIKKVTRRPPTVAQVRAQAERTIGTRSVSDLKPYLFQRAEAKAAKQAGELLAKGDLQGAFDAKQRELLNHELYRAAVNAKEQVDKATQFFKKISKPDDTISKTRDMDVVNAARAVLAGVGIGKTEAQVSEYLDQIKRNDPDTYATINALVEAAPARGNYKTLSFDQFIAVRDAVQALWDFAKSSRQIEIDGEKRDLQEVQSEMETAIRQRIKPGEKVGYDRAATKWEKTKMGLLGIRASLRRTEAWADSVDKGDSSGAMRRYLFNPIVEGTAKYRTAKAEFLRKYLDIIKPIESSFAREEILAPELGYRFSGRAELLGAILHSGNQSNLSKLLRGRGWGSVDEKGNLDTSKWDAFLARMAKEGTLTRQDYEFAQQIWDLMEELKPGAQRAHKQMYGYYFSEVTADEVRTPWGTFKGGFVPAKVDPLASSDPTLRQDEAAMEVHSGYAFPTTGRGSTKSRNAQYAAPLQMDLRFVPQHIDWALRFTHIEPHVKSASRIVLNRGFRKVLDQLDPTAASSLLVPWLQRAASQRVETSSQGWGGKAADTFFREVRRRTGLNIMVANVSNAIQQFTGLSISHLKVDHKYLRNALWQYRGSPKAMTDQVNEASEFMNTRVTGQVFEIQQHLDDLLLNPTKFEQARDFAQKHGYILQASTQNIVDVITWSGAYDQAMAQGEDDINAVRIADAAVRQTQGSFNAEDVSNFETGSPFMRAFSMFYSYFNMQANLLGTQFANIARDMGLRKGAGRALYVYTMGFMIPAVLSELIVKALSGKLDDDDDDQYLDDLMAAFFGAQFRTATAMFPIVGPAAQAGINQFNNKWYDDRITTSPAVSAIESAVSAPHSVYQAITADGSKKRAARDTLTALGLLTGYPVAPLARPLGYLSDIQEGKAHPTGPLDVARGLISGKSGNAQ